MSGRCYVKAGGGGSGPPAPLFVQLLLQGQTQQQNSIFNGSANSGVTPSTGDNGPSAASSQTLGWIHSAGASSYNIYRSDNPGTVYAAVSDSTAAANYSAYASASITGGWPYQTGNDRAWTDSAATNCVGYPRGSGPDFYAGNAYTYTVSAVSSGGAEGTRSAPNIAILFAGGINMHILNVFNGTLAFADGTSGTSPLGFTTNALWTCASSSDLINPYTGNSCTEWAFNAKGYNYLYLSVYAHQAGSSFQIIPELQGDMQMGLGAGFLTVQSTTYATLVNGAWVTCKIPIADIYTAANSAAAPNGPCTGLQHSIYKNTIQVNSGAAGNKFGLEYYLGVT